MKSTCSTYCGGKACRVWFQGAKKRPYEGQELNNLVTREVLEVLKQKKRAKATSTNDSSSYDEPENFNF